MTPPTPSTPSLDPQITALRDAYAALNRNDIPGFTSIFDPQIVRVEWPDTPQQGIYHGLAAVTAHIVAGRSTWADIQNEEVGRAGCLPQRFIIAGDRIIIDVHVRVRLKTETQWREGHTADVYTFQSGKAIEFRTFADLHRAMEWAGVKEPKGD